MGKNKVRFTVYFMIVRLGTHRTSSFILSALRSLNSYYSDAVGVIVDTFVAYDDGLDASGLIAVQADHVFVSLGDLPGGCHLLLLFGFLAAGFCTALLGGLLLLCGTLGLL